MTRYTEEFLEGLDPEVRALAVQQQRDDTETQRPQEFGHQPVLSLDAMLTQDEESSYAVGPDNTQKVVDGTPEHRQSSLVGIVADALSSLPEASQETYRLIYMDQLTIREAGAKLGIAHTSVLSRLRTIRAAVGEAVLAAGEDLDLG